MLRVSEFNPYPWKLKANAFPLSTYKQHHAAKKNNRYKMHVLGKIEEDSLQKNIALYIVPQPVTFHIEWIFPKWIIPVNIENKTAPEIATKKGDSNSTLSFMGWALPKPLLWIGISLDYPNTQ